MNVRTLRLPSAQGDGLVAHLIGFDAATFHADDFGRLGIDCPDAVRRSATARQAEFLHGRLAARAGLAALDRGKEPVGIGTHREPVWPDGVVGSISHTRSLAAAAVARRERCAGVGIDLQELVSDAFASTLLRQALNPHEATRLREWRSAEASRLALTVAYSAKESLFKALFPRVGRYFGFGAAIVTGYAPEAGEIRLELAGSLAPGLPAGRVFTLSFVGCAPATILTCALIDRVDAA